MGTARGVQAAAPKPSLTQAELTWIFLSASYQRSRICTLRRAEAHHRAYLQAEAKQETWAEQKQAGAGGSEGKEQRNISVKPKC